jgi:hypothetical protein
MRARIPRRKQKPPRFAGVAFLRLVRHYGDIWNRFNEAVMAAAVAIDNLAEAFRAGHQRSLQAQAKSDLANQWQRSPTRRPIRAILSRHRTGLRPHPISGGWGLFLCHEKAIDLEPQ